MFKFARTGINRIRLSMVIIVFLLIQIFIYQYTKQNKRSTEIYEPMMGNEVISEQTTKEKVDIWQIEIPSINLTAKISEGTTQEVLSQYVGHFENTQKEHGNIGLAAHNRGYEVNYFENLKNIQDGDEIKYIHNSYEKIYEVIKNRIIKDTDWEYLENTEENQLTLITCVENEPEYRRCVQAIEKEMEEDY